MTPTQIATRVDRGLEIKARIKALTDELKGIAADLEAAGLEADQIPLEESDRPGTQWLAKGSAKIVPVVFESDQIVGSFAAHSEIFGAIFDAIPSDDPGRKSDDFARFFRLKWERVFDDSLRFRREAFQQFGDQAGAAFIDACLSRDKEGIPRSRTVIDWSRARDRDDAAPAPANP